MYKPCRWCGGERSLVGLPSGVESKNPRAPVCKNAACPRKGQVPWKLPVLEFPFKGRNRGRRTTEENAGFDDLVRAIEDFG